MKDLINLTNKLNEMVTDLEIELVKDLVNNIVKVTGLEIKLANNIANNLEIETVTGLGIDHGQVNKLTGIKDVNKLNNVTNVKETNTVRSTSNSLDLKQSA